MKTIVVTLLIVGAAVAGAGWYFFMRPARVPAGAEANAAQPALPQSYTNSTYNFTLKMPAGYSAQEINTDSGETIVLHNVQPVSGQGTGDGIQITVSPFDEDPGNGYTLTKERILQDLPDIQMSDERPIQVGQGYTGLAFKTDDESFGTGSSAIWFVYKGNLYQIDTYGRLDPLLQAVFSTWQFTQ